MKVGNTPRTPLAGLDAGEKRVLNPRPFRVFRKTYSVGEVRVGSVVLVLLASLIAWVAWRGAHPDPALFADPATAHAASKPPADRGSLPPGLTAEGWKEGPPSQFSEKNLYEKIDGRADFFLSRGFRSLTFLTLLGPGGETVDIEMYDLGSPENALGAFGAEKPHQQEAKTSGGSSWYVARNALFLARGALYARAIGSDESPLVVKQLEAIQKAFESGVASGEKPWTVALFEDALSLPAGRLNFASENAFSFGFARNVTWAVLEDGETELFVAPAGDSTLAESLASKFLEGFLSYGEKVTFGGETWVKDRYLGSFSRAIPAGGMVAGVRGAPAPEKAAAVLEKLRVAILALPPEVAAKALAPQPEPNKQGSSAYE